MRKGNISTSEEMSQVLTPSDHISECVPSSARISEFLCSHPSVLDMSCRTSLGTVLAPCLLGALGSLSTCWWHLVHQAKHPQLGKGGNGPALHWVLGAVLDATM